MATNNKFNICLTAIISLNGCCKNNGRRKNYLQTSKQMLQKWKISRFWSIYEDGTRMLISKEHCCKYATNDPFWKEPKDVDFKVKTRAQKRKMKKTAMKDVVKYLSTEIGDEDQEIFEIKPTDYIVNFITAW